MKDIIKIVLVAFCAVFLINALKNIKPEYAYILSVSCGVLVLGFVLPKTFALIVKVKSLFSLTDMSYESLGIFFKCVIVCEICSLAKAFCRDSSNGFIASCIDFSEKTAIVILSMPLIEAVMKIIADFIGK